MAEVRFDENRGWRCSLVVKARRRTLAEGGGRLNVCHSDGEVPFMCIHGDDHRELLFLLDKCRHVCGDGRTKRCLNSLF